MPKGRPSIKELLSLIKNTFKIFWARDPFSSSIVVAYYTIFSLPGLLVIIINVAGYFYGTEAVTKQLLGQVGGMIGSDTARDVEAIVGKASESKGTVLSTILSVATLLFGATGVFYQIQQILNKIWEVEPKPKQKIWKLVRDRLFSFGLILVVGFLLLVSLVLSAGLSAFTSWFEHHISDALTFLFYGIDLLISLAVITVLLASMYKFLPDAKLRWSDVWLGAILSSILFIIAKFGLGLYFGKAEPGSAYGAAGSIVLIMLWVSYTGLIFFFGAEFTRVYADRNGHKVKPAEIAEKAAEADPAREKANPKPA
ncbi:MAG: YihY/virulence factor BrkB family protein [Chryseolinea sp.]